MKKSVLFIAGALMSFGAISQWTGTTVQSLNGRVELYNQNGHIRLWDINEGNNALYTQLERNGPAFHIYQHSGSGWTHSLSSASTGYIGIGGITSPLSNLHVKFAHEKELILQSATTNTFTGLSFRHSNGTENWRLRAFSNYPGGYNSMMALVGSGDFWIASNKVLIGGAPFDFTNCLDCNDYQLFVKKGIRTEQVKVDIAAGVWADYVFSSDYNLRSLSDVESFIKENNHLPGMPAADQVEKEGLNLGEMDAKLLEKVEELTLYLIEQQKQNELLRQELNELKADFEASQNK